MATLISFNPNRAVDLNSFAVPGALALFYDSGTSRPRIVYSDPECTLPHPSPLAADGAGVFPAIYDTGDGDVKVEVTTPEGVMLAGYPMDPARVVDTENVGASAIQFSPTEDIPETNVQAAIERLQTNMIQPLLDYGLGVTGNAVLLTDFDAAGIASGFYRFNESTTGTRPSGIAANATGIILVWRQTSGDALMHLVQQTARRHYLRAQSGGEWGDWSYFMQSTDTATDSIWAAGSSTAPYTATPKAVRVAAAAVAIGAGQTWQTPNRNVGTTYTNNTNRTIQVCVCANASGLFFQVANATGAFITVAPTFNFNLSFTALIPPGGRYRMMGSGGVTEWAELR